VKVTKKSIVSEIIIGLFFFQLFNFLGWKNNPGFYGLEPHPYLILILLAASRYGNMAGIVSASFSAAALAGISYLFRGLHPAHDPYLFKQYIVFLLMGAVIGELRQMYIKRELGVREELEREKMRSENLNEENRLVKKVNAELEKRVLDNVSTFAGLYETSKQLQSFNPSEIYRAILQLMTRHIHAEQCSLYLLKKDELVLKETTGTEGDVPESINLLFEDGIIIKAVTNQRVYSVRDIIDSDNASAILKEGTPVMAAPLIKTDGTVIGAISIEKIPFFHITGSTVKMFTLLADWVSKDIENALYYQEAKKKNILDEVLNVYTLDYFNNRLAQEFYRSKRYGVPLSIIFVRIVGLDKMSRPLQVKMLKFTASFLNSTLRFTDIVSRYSEEIQFGLILTTTDQSQAQMAIRRFLTIFDQIGLNSAKSDEPLELEFGIGSCISTVETKEQMIELAKEDLKKWDKEKIFTEQ
jgi:GGDEF domain-containing protein